MLPGMGQGAASTKGVLPGMKAPKIRAKPLLLGQHGDKPQKGGLTMPSLKLPSIRSLLAGGLK